jgi:peptidyl-prolyl cis-trans isomerase D
MLKTLQQRKRGVQIVLGVILGAVCIAMVITMVPGGPIGSQGASPDAVATVDGNDITVTDVTQKLNRLTQGQSVPAMLRGIYAQQVLNQMIFERLLVIEGKRLGLQVTPQEVTDRIKQLLPTVFSGDTWMKDRYAAEVQMRTGMSVPEFEDWVQQNLLEEKFQMLVTSGITVSPEEIQQEFRRRNEKVKLDYVMVKPTELATTINPSDAELATYFEKNASRYQVPEKRVAHYALLDLTQLRQKSNISDAELRAFYDQHLDRYKVQDRVHVEHILFKTIGKTDAEVAEIRKNAEAVLKQAKRGENFEDLAKKNSQDDATKAKGGDLGWIVRQQTVPEFEKAAFGLPKGSISDLVKTEYGFHIIKVLDRETAHTKSFEEVRGAILASLLGEKVETLANKMSDEMASVVRRSSSQSIDQFAKALDSVDPLARQCLVVGETPLAGVTEPIGDLGNAKELDDALFSLHQGEMSLPIRLDRGYVVLSLKQIEPTHPGKLAEVRDKVLSDFRRDKSLELARARAEELARRAKAGEDFAKVAKSLGLEVKTSELIARTGSISGLGSAREVDSAFSMPVGQTGVPVSIEGNWVVYRVAAREEPNPADFASKQGQIQQSLLQDKRTTVYEAFRTDLEDRMKREGKLSINAQVLKRLSTSS